MSPSPSDCPDELYNLTKLAEVSLAAASGQLYHHRHLSTIPLHSPPTSSRSLHSNSPAHSNSSNHAHSPPPATSYTHKLFDRDRDRSTAGGIEQDGEGEEKGWFGEGGQHKLFDRDRDRSAVGGVDQDGEGEDKGWFVEGGQEQEQAQHECPDCGKRYSTSSNLARHRQTHRSLADKKARRCPHCDKVYVSMPAYSMHVRTHVQGCRCPYCGKCFSRPWLLQGHIRTHTGEKPFRCPQCAKAFADKSNLRAHVQTHSDTKPHVCSRCGKAFALKSYLYKHEESSCMRHTIGKPVPTPVIVRPSVISSPCAERAVHGVVERPVSKLIAGRCCVEMPVPPRVQEVPVDFSRREYGEEGRMEFAGRAIAV